jgi:HlyD family secretion protein
MERKYHLTGVLKRYWPFGALMILILVSLAVFQFRTASSRVEATPMQDKVIVAHGNIRLSAFGSGVLTTATEKTLKFEISGIVKAILVESGDEVAEGQLLVLLDDTTRRETLANAEAVLHELTSDAAVAEARLEIAQAQKAVLTAQSTLMFYLSPYVYKAEIRLRDAEGELQAATSEAALNPSDKTDQKVREAQKTVDDAALSLEMDQDTYQKEYVPDFFNFPWWDRFGFRHDYYDPPSETEIALAWAELAQAEARLDEAQDYLDVLLKGVVPDTATGSNLITLENAKKAVSEASWNLENTKLTSSLDGVVIHNDFQEYEQVGSTEGITIAQLDPPTLEASFDEGDWSLVKAGNPIEVTFDALPEKTFRGQIVFVDPSLQTHQYTSVVSARVELDTSLTGWTDLPLQSSASIEVIAGEVKDALLVPLEALIEDSGNRGAVLLLENGEYSRIEVELGLRDALYVEVLEGLSEGDVVFVEY